MLYLFALILIFIALFLASVTLALSATDRRQMRRFQELALAGQGTSVEQELAQPFFDRIILPVLHLFSQAAKRVSPAAFIEHLGHQLILAGHPRELNVDKLLAVKTFFALCGFLSFIPLYLLASLSPAKSLQVSLILAVVASLLPDLWLNQKINQRQKAIKLALPDTLDLLHISVEAGLGFDAALSKIISNSRGPLSEEFFRMLQEIRLGTPRREAFKNLSERTNVPELSSFILAMLQADIFGISIGKVLRVQAQEMRIKRRQQAEEIAMKAPVKIVFPLVLCIFPALLVVVLGPAVINIYQAIIKGL